MIIDALRFVTMTNAEVRALGVPAERISYDRERMTGHVRRVQPQWARAIGWFGGVATISEIAAHVDVEIATAIEYAKYRGLKWRTKKRQYTQAQLAVLALATTGTAREAAARWGLMPVEAVLYRACATEVLVQHETTLTALLTWSPADLERRWRQLDLRVEAPEPLRRDIREPGYLDELVARAERMAAGEDGT